MTKIDVIYSKQAMCHFFIYGEMIIFRMTVIIFLM
jgi:hypothetical protein